mgnify:CR=1 FL=1
MKSMHDARYVDGSYTEKNSGFSQNESLQKALEFLRIARSNNVQLESILDFGCGGGGFLKSIFSKNLFSEINCGVGIDINNDAISFASENNSDHSIRFHCVSLNEFRSERKFDVACAVHVLEHLQNWEDVALRLSEISNMCYFVVPVEASVWHTLRPSVLKGQYDKYGHINFFNEAYFKHRLEELGFEIIDLDYSNEFISFTGTGANLLKFPRLVLGGISKSLCANWLGGYCLQVLCKRAS